MTQRTVKSTDVVNADLTTKLVEQTLTTSPDLARELENLLRKRVEPSFEEFLQRFVDVDWDATDEHGVLLNWFESGMPCITDKRISQPILRDNETDPVEEHWYRYRAYLNTYGSRCVRTILAPVEPDRRGNIPEGRLSVDMLNQARKSWRKNKDLVAKCRNAGLNV